MHHLPYAKSGCLTNTPTRLHEDGTDDPRNAPECLVVKQRDLVCESWCIKCWFNDGKTSHWHHICFAWYSRHITVMNICCVVILVLMLNKYVVRVWSG